MRRAILVNTSRAYLTLDEVIEETGAREELIAELENFGIVQPEKREGKTVYDETDREIVRAANELSRFGVGARNLRVFRSSADREANLLEALLGPSLRSRNPERRKEALESLESLAATVSHLKHLLLGPQTCARLGRRTDGSRRQCPGSPAEPQPIAARRARTARSGSWSPTPTACRAGGRGRCGSRASRARARRAQWTKVLETAEGRGVRADFRCTEHGRGRALVWEQQIPGTPFERTCAAPRSRSGCEAEGDGTDGDASRLRRRCAASRASARR